MVRNVNINVNSDLFFTLSFELVRRLTILGFPVNLSGDWLFPNIKHWKFSTEHMPGAIEGVVGEGKSFSWGVAWTKGEVHKHELNTQMLLHSDLLTSLSSSLTQLCCMIVKLVFKVNGVKI